MNGSSMLDARPDKKGVKNVARALLVGSLIVLTYGYADLQAHRFGLNEEQVDTLLATPNALEATGKMP